MLLKILSILPLLLLILSCRETGSSSSAEFAEVVFKPDTSDSGRIFIRDYTGKEWDVTHAVENYGFEADKFQYGLGPYAIRPILEPKFLSPGDLGYDSVDEHEIVIGTVINDDARAYPLSILSRHEIANEKFDRTYVAVGY